MDHEIVKWYTRARRFPQLIGRTHDGTRIPGGPYTYTQFIGGFVVLFVGVNTMGLWARFGLITNVTVLATGTYATVWLLGRAPQGSRGPMAVVTGLVRVLFRPRLGTVQGRPVRVPHPHRLSHDVTIAAHAGSTGEAGLTAPAPAAPGSRAPATPLTGVERALAAARLRHDPRDIP